MIILENTNNSFYLQPAIKNNYFYFIIDIRHIINTYHLNTFNQDLYNMVKCIKRVGIIDMPDDALMLFN